MSLGTDQQIILFRFKTIINKNANDEAFEFSKLFHWKCIMNEKSKVIKEISYRKKLFTFMKFYSLC